MEQHCSKIRQCFERFLGCFTNSLSHLWLLQIIKLCFYILCLFNIFTVRVILNAVHSVVLALPRIKNVRHVKTQRRPPDLTGVTIYIQFSLSTFFFSSHRPLWVCIQRWNQCAEFFASVAIRVYLCLTLPLNSAA